MTAHRVTRADLDAALQRASKAEGENGVLRRDNQSLKAENERLRTSLQAANNLRQKATDKVDELTARLETADERHAHIVSAQEEAAPGPNSDAPRWLYRADGQRPTRRVVANLSAEEELRKTEEGMWFSSPEAASDEYFRQQGEELAQE